jgi:predicted transposase YdaD
MHDYDTVLKSLPQYPENSIFERITGAKIGRWLKIELPEVQQTRVDLLAETADSLRSINLEFQSSNDLVLPLRMAEHALRVYRAYQRFPEQYVLYVGNAELRMPHKLVGPNFFCQYLLIDSRDLDGETLLSSPFANDNIIAILARHRDNRETIRRILESIAKMEAAARDLALSKLMILAGLGKLGEFIKTETKHKPILDDIMDHDVIGPAIRKGLEKGLQNGRQEDLNEGIHRESLAISRRLITKRFGPLPPTLAG